MWYWLYREVPIGGIDSICMRGSYHFYPEGATCLLGGTRIFGMISVWTVSSMEPHSQTFQLGQYLLRSGSSSFPLSCLDLDQNYENKYTIITIWHKLDKGVHCLSILSGVYIIEFWAKALTFDCNWEYYEGANKHALSQNSNTIHPLMIYRPEKMLKCIVRYQKIINLKYFRKLSIWKISLEF